MMFIGNLDLHVSFKHHILLFMSLLIALFPCVGYIDLMGFLWDIYSLKTVATISCMSQFYINQEFHSGKCS